MRLQTRTWPYGTVKRVRVVHVIEESRVLAIICEEEGDPKTGYACLYKPGQEVPAKGDRGTLTFVKGGPTGGFWQYRGEDRCFCSQDCSWRA